LITIENAYAAPAHAPNHVTREGVKNNYIFGILDPDLPIYYTNFYWATTTIKGLLLSSRPMLKQFSGEKIQGRIEIGPKNGGFGEK